MRVVEFNGAGGPEVLRFADRPIPTPAPGEVLIRVAAAAVNRPDIQQRRGLYPAPPGASDLPGLDVAGWIEAVGDEVQGLSIGQPVCALANGGGYAEFCAVPWQQCLPVPRGLNLVEAASLPEVFFTAWNNIMVLGHLGHGESLLIQGGTSGVGMAGIQIARKLRDAVVYATAGTEEKRQVCRNLGAREALDYRGDWDGILRERVGERGIDLILDAQAGPYTQRQLDLLAFDGRLVLIASHLGAQAEVNLRQLVRRRQTLTGSTIRPQSAERKGRLADDLRREVWPLIEAGEIATHLHAVLPFSEVAEAHRILDANEQIGKVVLCLDEAATRPREGR